MIGIDSNFLIACELQEHAHHTMARQLLDSLVSAKEQFVLAPQVIAEFIHIVTDGRRLQSPRTVAEALELADLWRTASDVAVVAPGLDAIELFFRWMSEFSLGRKRVLDTMLAATYATAGVSRIATIDIRDFQVFGVFQFVAPAIV